MVEIESEDRKDAEGLQEAVQDAIEPLVRNVCAVLDEIAEARQEIKALRCAEDPERLLTKKEAADLLGVSERTVDKLVHSGEIQSLKVRRARRIPHRALAEYIERRVNGGGPSRG